MRSINCKLFIEGEEPEVAVVPVVSRTLIILKIRHSQGIIVCVVYTP